MHEVTGKATLMTQREQLAEIQELLDEICGRCTAMYVGSRTFLHVEIFVNGYLGGRCHGNGLNLSQYIGLFGAWLARRHAKSPSIGWGRVVMELCSDVDELALEHTPRLFRQFCDECGDFDKKRWFHYFGPWMRPWSEPSRTT